MTVKLPTDKYDRLRKLARNKRLNNYMDENPGASLERVGKRFSISKQRVHQLRRVELKRREKEKAAAPVEAAA